MLYSGINMLTWCWDPWIQTYFPMFNCFFWRKIHFFYKIYIFLLCEVWFVFIQFIIFKSLFSKHLSSKNCFFIIIDYNNKFNLEHYNLLALLIMFTLKFHCLTYFVEFFYLSYFPLYFLLDFCICSIQYVLAQIDNCIQYGEDADVKVKDFDPEEDD